MNPETTSQQNHQPISHNEMEEWIAGIQPDLRGYVISINGSAADIDDILQETNIFIWERQADFVEGSSFKAWAFRIAYFKSMAQRRDSARRGHVSFSESTIQRISVEAENFFHPANDRLSALQRCVKKLKPAEQNILFKKYVQGGSFTDFASNLGKSVAATHQIASRARVALRHCINQQISNS